MSNLHGRFVWYELMTTDAVAAEAFYRKVVGWGARDAGQPGMAYTLFLAGAIPVAGAMAMPEAVLAAGAKPAWIGYVSVEDVDFHAARVAETGGTVHHAPTDIPGVGRFAIVADPHGAVFALFKDAPAGMAPPAADPNVPGYTGWRELMAGDGAAAFAFYAALFGWTKAEALDMGPMGTYQLYAAGGETLGGIMTKPPQMAAPAWHYYFQVDAVEAAIGRLKAGGGTVINGPHQVPGGLWIVQALDPQGAMFCLVSPKL